MVNSLSPVKGHYGICNSVASSPTQTQSTLNSATSPSDASSSPPGPSTPPRSSISRTRYGDLGRVPLHRRGTSKTYERLEDLLKEAGYKETRVFTPEAERLETDADPKAEENRLSGIGAVVDFLTNLFPGGDRRVELPDDEGDSPRDYSPLGDRGPSTISSSIDSLHDTTPRPTRQVSQATQRLQQTYQKYTPDPSLPPSQPSLYQPHPHVQNLVQPRPSRAGAYLRHMASNVSMPPPARPNSTPVHSRPGFSIRNNRDQDGDDPSVIFSRKGNGEGEEDRHGQPPLPTTWLESVARAVLFGGTGAHVGGPHPDDLAFRSQQHYEPQQPQPSQTTHTLRTTRSSLSQVTSHRQSNKPSTTRRTGLSDQTNAPGANACILVPPPLVVSLERGRAGRSEGEVTRTRVVCRSAPGSRAGSLVRPGDKVKQGGQPRGRGAKRRNAASAEKDRVPSLAKTQTEGDAWNHGRGRASQGMTASEVKNKYLMGMGAGDADMDDSEGVGFSSDDDDEGELNLARMLVHPRRQQSIRSLRKHLDADLNGGGGSVAVATLTRTSRGMSIASKRSPASNSGAASALRKSSIAEQDDWDRDQDWGAGWAKREGRDDDEAESFAEFFVGLDGSRTGPQGNNNTGKGRPGFANWGSRGQDS